MKNLSFILISFIIIFFYLDKTNIFFLITLFLAFAIFSFRIKNNINIKLIVYSRIVIILLLMFLLLWYAINFILNGISIWSFSLIVVLIILFLIVSYIFFQKKGIKTHDIYYYRDIPDDYTPLEISYLVNEKIEIKKDFLATIINLYAKKIIYFVKENDKFKIKLNTNNVNISQDERYVLDWYLNKENNYSLLELEDIITKQLLDKNIYSSVTKMGYSVWMIIIFSIISLLCTFLAYFGIITINLYISVLIILIIIGSIIFVYFNSRAIHRVLTDYGKKEYTKILSFKKFLLEFTLIKDRTIEEKELWGQYLSYAICLNINNNSFSDFDEELKKIIDKENIELIENILINLEK